MPLIDKIHLRTEITFCKICGSEVKQKKKGRYREYCSDNCQDYYRFFSALDRTLTKINFVDYVCIKSVKSDLFCLVNSLPKKIKE